MHISLFMLYSVYNQLLIKNILTLAIKGGGGCSRRSIGLKIFSNTPNPKACNFPSLYSKKNGYMSSQFISLLVPYQ